MVIRPESWGLEGSKYRSYHQGRRARRRIWWTIGWPVSPQLPKRDCGVCMLADLQEPPGHSPGQAALGDPAWAEGWDQLMPREAFPPQPCCDSLRFSVWYRFQCCLSHAYTHFSFKTLHFCDLVPQLNGLWNTDINTPSYVPWKHKYAKDREVFSGNGAYKCLLYTFIGKRNFTIFFPLYSTNYIKVWENNICNNVLETRS